MKFTFNIEKKHLVILIVFLVIIVAGFTLADQFTWSSQNNPPSHDTLWTNEVRSKSSPTAVKVHDDLNFDSGKGIWVGTNKKISDASYIYLDTCGCTGAKGALTPIRECGRPGAGRCSSVVEGLYEEYCSGISDQTQCTKKVDGSQYCVWSEQWPSTFCPNDPVGYIVR